MDKNTCKNIVIIILLVFVLLLGYQIMVKKENFTMTEQSNEAVQNIASVYADTSGTVSFNNLNVTGNFNMIPRGTVIMWTGTTAPSGWALCDGGTYKAIDGTSFTAPDLRGRFVLGYNADQNTTIGSSSSGHVADINTGARVGSGQAGPIGTNGGEVMHTLSVNEMPAHTHNFAGGPFNPGWTSGNGGGNDWAVQTRTTDPTGGSNPWHSTLPPYYVLAFIVKL